MPCSYNYNSENTSDNPNHHMKRKKGARSNFYRKKCVERKQHQQAQIDLDDDLRDTSSNSQEVHLNVLLPPQWHDFSDGKSQGVAAQYSKMEKGPNDVIQATRSVLLYEDKSWSV